MGHRSDFLFWCTCSACKRIHSKVFDFIRPTSKCQNHIKSLFYPIWLHLSYSLKWTGARKIRRSSNFFSSLSDNSGGADHRAGVVISSFGSKLHDHTTEGCFTLSRSIPQAIHVFWVLLRGNIVYLISSRWSELSIYYKGSNLTMPY